jgi:cell division protein ZapA (FtsZ GTPase activity inhibitor)
MSEAARVELTLLGQTLTLRSEAPEAYLRSLAAYVEERVRTLQQAGVRDPLRALCLAAIDITDELFRAREDHAREDVDVRGRLGALVALLEQVAPPAESP